MAQITRSAVARVADIGDLRVDDVAQSDPEIQAEDRTPKVVRISVAGEQPAGVKDLHDMIVRERPVVHVFAIGLLRLGLSFIFEIIRDAFSGGLRGPLLIFEEVPQIVQRLEHGQWRQWHSFTISILALACALGAYLEELAHMQAVQIVDPGVFTKFRMFGLEELKKLGQELLFVA